MLSGPLQKPGNPPHLPGRGLLLTLFQPGLTPFTRPRVPETSLGLLRGAGSWRHIRSPAEVAHEAAALLIQEALPAVGRLHPALPGGPPVLPEERHGTARRRSAVRVNLVDATGRAASGTRRPGRTLGCGGRRGDGLQGTGVEGFGFGVQSRVRALAEGAGRCAGEGRGAGGMRRRRPGRGIYPGPLAAALCCRKSRLLLARPPARRPRGFVYELGLFSEVPAAPALRAVAQPRAGGNLKPSCQARAPAAPPLLSPALPPRPPGAATAAPRASRTLGRQHPFLPLLPAGGVKLEGSQRGVWVTVGRDEVEREPPFHPELSEWRPAVRARPGAAPPGAEWAGGSAFEPFQPRPRSWTAEGQPCTPPCPENWLTGPSSVFRLVSRVSNERGEERRPSGFRSPSAGSGEQRQSLSPP